MTRTIPGQDGDNGGTSPAGWTQPAGMSLEQQRQLIRGIPARTLAARLRPLLPEIEQRVQDGVGLQELVDALNTHGGLGRVVRLGTLRKYLARSRRAARKGAAPPARSAPQLGAASPGAPVGRPQAPPAQTATAPTRLVTPSDLRRLREEPIDMEGLQKLGQEFARREREKERAEALRRLAEEKARHAQKIEQARKP